MRRKRCLPFIWLVASLAVGLLAEAGPTGASFPGRIAERAALGAPTIEGLSVSGGAVAAPTLPTFLGTLAGPSVGAMYDSGLEFDEANNRIVVADTGNDRILFYDEKGTKLGSGIGSYGAGDGQFDTPRDVAIGPNAMIYVADAGNNRVQAFNSAGAVLWPRGGLRRWGLCLDKPVGGGLDPPHK